MQITTSKIDDAGSDGLPGEPADLQGLFYSGKQPQTQPYLLDKLSGTVQGNDMILPHDLAEYMKKHFLSCIMPHQFQWE